MEMCFWKISVNELTGPVEKIVLIYNRLLISRCYIISNNRRHFLFGFLSVWIR